MIYLGIDLIIIELGFEYLGFLDHLF
jgi:hypothetical protein